VVRGGLPRAVEACVALLGLVLCVPMLVVLAVGVAVSSRGSVFFQQERVGRGGRRFRLYKLRTMRSVPSGPLVTAGDDSRVTWVGRLLRRSKLDELPQLWNVVRGDMALVGPRPEVPHYVDLDNALWRKVLEVRPGITDPVTLRLRNEEILLMQVAGDYEEFYLHALQPAKLRGYVEYLENRTWWSDVKVLCGSIVAVIRPRKSPPSVPTEVSAGGRDYH